MNIMAMVAETNILNVAMPSGYLHPSGGSG